MNKNEVIKELSKLYPHKDIVLLPEDEPSEIICEIDPTSNHNDYSVAIAVIDKSTPHKHLVSTERYRVLRGELTLVVDGQKHVLKANDEFMILPGQVHYAIGNETWVECESKPGWTLSDHIIIE